MPAERQRRAAGSRAATRRSARLALTYLGRHKLPFARALFWRGLYEFVPMQLPLLTGILVDGLTRGSIEILSWERNGVAPHGLLPVIAALMILVALVHGYSSYARIVAAAKLSRRFVSELRLAIVRKLAYLSLDLHQEYGTAELFSRALADTQRTRLFLERVFIQMFVKLLRVGYPVIMVFLIDARLAVVAMSVLIPQWLITRNLQQRVHDATVARRASQVELTEVVKEGLDGIETIKALHAQDEHTSWIAERSGTLEGDQLQVSRLSAMLSGTVWLTTGVGLGLTWWIGGLAVLRGEMSIGTLIIFTGFVTFAYQPFRQFANIAKSYRQGVVSLERIQHLLEMRSTVEERPDARDLIVERAQVSAHDVNFSYGDEAVLRHVSLRIPAGSFAAVVGRSGCGKSSLLRLIPRFFDPDRGEIRIDDTDVREVTLDSLRRQVAVVPQRPILFSGTLEENLLLARPDASRMALEQACAAAHVLDFVRDLEQGFETRIGPGGVNVSGGEAQRIALARALLCRPKVLLLDEPTSSLDGRSETAVLEALQELRGRVTVVVVGHRLNAVRVADRIFVLDRGSLVGEGTHTELIRSNAVYRDLFGGDDVADVSAASSARSGP